MAGAHKISKFRTDDGTFYDIDEGTPNWKTFDTKDMRNWLLNNDTVYAEIGGEKYITPEYSKWKEETNAQIEKEREESGIAEKERKIRNDLLSKVGDKETIERFKEYFKGELAKDGGRYDMYKDILAFLEGKKTVDDFVEGEIVINDFPNSVMQEIREKLGLNAISITDLHSMIKEYGMK